MLKPDDGRGSRDNLDRETRIEGGGGVAARLLLAATALFFGGGAALAQGPANRAPTKVIVAPAEARVLVSRVEALGTLRPNERVDITAPVTEQIAVIHVDDGALVAAGDKLVELRHAQEDALLEEAKATLAEALEQLEVAENLFERGAGSETLLNERKRDAAVSRARVRSAEAQIADRVLAAPFKGRIGIRNFSPGATVEPGDVILRLIDDSVLKLDFSVPNTVLSELKLGAEIEARARALPGEKFAGKVEAIDAEADPVTRSVLVRALIPNEDRRLLPGLLMEVNLLVNERPALVIPEGALIPFGEDTFAMLVVDKEDGPHVERRKVQTGARRVGYVEILGGLEAGDLVVVEGALKLRPGQPVAPQPQRPPQEDAPQEDDPQEAPGSKAAAGAAAPQKG